RSPVDRGAARALGIRRQSGKSTDGGHQRHVTLRRSRRLVVVGGGLAGVAAAIEARRAGLETCLVEQHSRLAAPEALLGEVAASGAEARLDTAAWGIWGHDLAVCEPNVQSWVLTFEQLIIATGSFARPVAFPGWTLPGVAIGGAAPPRGARVAVAGFGSDL